MKNRFFYLSLGLFLCITAAHSESYNITVSSDGIADDGNCTLREALQAAFTQQAVDQCPAGDADTNSINLLTSVGTYNFNLGEFAVSAGTVPSLSIASNASNANERPVINLGLNNRFLRWPDFVDETLTINRVAFFLGKDADDMGGGALKIEGETIDDESTLAVLNIVDTTFLTNSSDGDGGALHLSGEIQLFVFRSLFQGNQADAGAALYMNNTGLSRNAFINDTEFTLNTSRTGHAALNISYDTLDSPENAAYPRVGILRGLFTENTADGLGGIAGAELTIKNAAVTVDDSKFLDNAGSGLFTQLLENSTGVRDFDEIRFRRLEFKDSYLPVLGLGVYQMHIVRTGFDAVTGEIPRVNLSEILMYQTGTPTAGGLRVVDDAPLVGLNGLTRQVTLVRWTLVGHQTALVSFHPEQGAVQVFESILYDNGTNDSGNSAPDYTDNLIDTDPQFETAFGTDFYPGANSPAIDQSSFPNNGFPANQFQQDVLRHPRTIGSNADLGAVERQTVNQLTLVVSGQGQVEIEATEGNFVDCDASTSPCVYDIPSELYVVFNGFDNPNLMETIWQGNCRSINTNASSSSCDRGYVVDDNEVLEVYFGDVIFKSGFD